MFDTIFATYLNELNTMQRLLMPVVILASMTLSSACSKSEDMAGIGKIEVSIGAPALKVSSSTRTEMESDQETIRWSSNDKISLWAYNGTTATFSNERFALKSFSQNYTTAYFTGNITPMAEGTYSYYAAYPQPQASAGSSAEYDIPSTQNGAYNSNYDIMLASLESAPALAQGINYNTELHFIHKMHFLKITIPTGKNLAGRAIKSLTIIFPKAVTGHLAFDVTKPTAAPTITNGSNTLKLNFATPINEGSTVWATIAPVDLTEGEIEFYAETDTFETKSLYSTFGKQMTGGHTTPINLTIATTYGRDLYKFNIGTNNLGESIKNLILTPSTGSTSYNVSADIDGTFTWRCGGYRKDSSINPDEFAKSLNNSTLKIACESENAIVNTNPITIGDLTTSVPAATLTVPYLLYEDFSTIATFSDNETAATSDPAAIWLSTKGLSSGWSAARVGGEAGKSIRICCRYESGLGITALYEGRMDTAPLSGLKASASVKIKCSFNIDGSRRSKSEPVCEVGWTTNSGLINGGANLDNSITSYTLGTSGSFSSISSYKEITISSATSATRISWRASTNRGGSFGANDEHYTYLDNIKVQITQ